MVKVTDNFKLKEKENKLAVTYYSNYIFSAQTLCQENSQLRYIKSIQENSLVNKAMNKVIKALISIFMAAIYKIIPT